jgi:multiple sugar transport system substrate-binding protein
MKSLLVNPDSNNLSLEGGLKESIPNYLLNIPLSRRELLKLTGISLLSYTLAACNGLGFSSTPTVEKKIQLVYQDWNTPWFSAMAQTMLTQFHTEHPDISAFYTLDPPSESFDEKTMADFQAGTAPDVFQGCCSFFPTWEQKGYTLDLRPYVKQLDQSTLSDWDPVQYRAFFARDGKQFGLPKYHGALALYYNKDLFDQNKVDYPDEHWNHDDYRSAMRLLTRKRDGSDQIIQWGSMLDISWDRIQVHVNGWGGHFVDPVNPSHCMMAEPQALQAMEWLRACMWDEKIMATPLDVQNISIQEAFTSEKVAMVEDGSWSLKTILSNANFRVGIAPFPAGPARRVTLATTDGFGIYAGTKYPDAAWELLKFLISKDYGRAMAKANLLQPARASLVDEWADLVKKEFPNQAKEINPAVFADGHLKGYSVVAEVFANQAGAQRLIDQAWNKVFRLGQASVESLKTVAQQVESTQP